MGKTVSTHKKNDPEIIRKKVLLLGHVRVGKTTIIHQLLNLSENPRQWNQTIGTYSHVKPAILNGREISLILEIIEIPQYDFCKHYDEPDVVVFVYAIDRENSFTVILKD